MGRELDSEARAGLLPSCGAEDDAGALPAEVELRLVRAEAARAQELLAAHNRVHQLINGGAPLDDVMLEVARSIEQHDPSVIPCIVLLDRDSSTLHPGAAPSLPSHYVAAIDGVVIGPNIGACGSAAWSGELTISDDIGSDPRWAPVRDFVLDAGLQHCWSMPVAAPGGDVLGTLALYGPEPRRPEPEHLTLMRDWARILGIAIERDQSLQRLLHDARHDSLTGLPNRSAIFETLDEVLESTERDGPAALLFVDLDGLKALNDTLGHDRADEVIREVAGRLRATIRKSDFVGRFGGDEFVVVAKSLDRDEAAELGLRLLDAVSHPIEGPASTVVTASVGITMVRNAAIESREAIRQADAAMYEAKRSGRDRCVFFGGMERVRTGRRLLVARSLRGAELRGELALAFQPIFDVASGEVVAIEALARWTSPDLGAVPPDEFIPVAEDTGSIVPLGAWALREACETTVRLLERLERPVQLAVNVSTHQLTHPGFAVSVGQTVAHAQLPPELLALEITETALMHPNARAESALAEIESLGVEVVLDDFGTGFSSLSWLKHKRLGGLKVDRSFVSGLDEDDRDEAIVAAVIAIAHAVGCTVTAEGVETEEQLDVLRRLGCARAQGFLLARPLPADELPGVLLR